MSHIQRHSSATRGKCRVAQLLFLLLWFGKTFGSVHIPKEYKISDMKQPPLITYQSHSYTAFYTDDILLRCEASGNPKPSIRWLKDNTLFKEESNGTGVLTADENEELRFYQGTYRCYASNDLGTAESGLIHLNTESIPAVSVKEKRVTKIVNEGDHVVLQCNIPSGSVPAAIHWMDKKLMHIKQSDRITIGLNGNLYFANAIIANTRDDYTCYPQYIEARTILSTDPVALMVNPSNDVVKKAPGLHQPEGTHTTYNALRGQNLILECIPYGLPTPEVKWDRKDAALSSTEATVERFGRWLDFASIEESDNGEYTCTASNIIGKVTHSYTVNVEAAPYWNKQPESALYSPGETIKLDCHAKGIPTPHVTWKINGMPLSETSPEPRRTVRGGTLILTDVQLSDTAVYQCEASNKHGTALLNTYIYIIELSPQILTDDSRVYRVTEGSTVSLHCNSFGSPRPHISWSFLNRETEQFSPLLSDLRTSLLTSGVLQITNISHEDAGTYLCSVKENTSVSITALLDVLNKTRIVSPLYDLRRVSGTSLTWPCKYEVDARLSKPTILWRKDGQKIEKLPPDNKYTIFENGSLMISEIHAKDSGFYSCEVISTLDVDMASGSLTVIDKPAPPHSLKLDEKANRSVTLSWSPGHDNNSPVFDFVIEIREDVASEKSSWKELKRVAAEIHHLEISLHPFCTYHFKVAAVNEIGASNFSLPSKPYTTSPAAPDMNPGNVRSESQSPDSMIITWEELEPRQFNGPGFGYKVSWRDAADPDSPWQTSELVSHPPFTVSKTGTFAPFEIKVQAANKVFEGPNPEPAIGYSGEDVPTEAPTGLKVIMVNATVASVTWDPVSRESVRGHLRGYKLYLTKLVSKDNHRGKRSLATVIEMIRDMESGMERQEIVVEGKDRAIVSGLDFFTDYELSVSAFNSKGAGPLSPPISFQTLEGAPGPPVNFRYKSPSETELTLLWRKPDKTNGVLRGYILIRQEFVENGPSTIQTVKLDDPTVTEYKVDGLDKQNYYIFSLKAFTAAGEGEPIHINATTLLDGVPPNSINATMGETFVNLSWVPGERQRNFAFTILYMMNDELGQWEESEQVNSTEGFYQLQGLKSRTNYQLKILHNNVTHWEQQLLTEGPKLQVVNNNFATQGWFIGLISAVVLLLLLLLILCFVKKSKGGKYSVKDKEEGQLDCDAKPMKDEGFGEYRSLESSDNDEKRSFSQRSLSAEMKRESDDSLVEYGDSVDIQFNEDGSFIGQYSGRRDTQPYAHGEQESSGVPSPTNPNTHPPASNSFLGGILGGN